MKGLTNWIIEGVVISVVLHAAICRARRRLAYETVDGGIVVFSPSSPTLRQLVTEFLLTMRINRRFVTRHFEETL